MHCIIQYKLNNAAMNYLEGNNFWSYVPEYGIWISTRELDGTEVAAANTAIGGQGAVVPISQVSFDRHLPLR